ncbi:hypothetical protein H2201_008210 [Coniosporium apollinis]|uniref:Uncharacterized protein n=1 Tax=Coniosporium apollinis TaxID=61459 RepID=A0ABQ9NK85_9PEZI|nr:hypothetical protein H2201_008210 [Coniosporium apollinis]
MKILNAITATLLALIGLATALPAAVDLALDLPANGVLVMKPVQGNGTFPFSTGSSEFTADQFLHTAYFCTDEDWTGLCIGIGFPTSEC